jgi:hypothetical protein
MRSQRLRILVNTNIVVRSSWDPAVAEFRMGNRNGKRALFVLAFEVLASVVFH